MTRKGRSRRREFSAPPVKIQKAKEFAYRDHVDFTIPEHKLDLHDIDDVEFNNIGAGLGCPVEAFLDDKFSSGENRVSIIYGVGKGVVKKKVMSYLRSPNCKYIKKDSIIETPGYCIVELDN